MTNKEQATAQVRLYPSTRKTLNILAAKWETSIAHIVQLLVDIEKRNKVLNK